jgi:signal transduction histidine kinase
MQATLAHEELLHSLVHDLRQPLGNIETGIFYLDLMLDEPSNRVRDQLRAMENQVALAANLLQQAVEELRALRTQRTSEVPAESFDFTKSATAVVT